MNIIKKITLGITCIAVLLTVGCESVAESVIKGCTDSTACNYDIEATQDNNTCTYAMANMTCSDACINDVDSDGICDESEFDLCGNITTNDTLYAQNDYTLSCQTFVKDGVTLTIMPGTTIKATSDDGNGLAPALVIEQGAKIMAEGTADQPITFTSITPSNELINKRGNWGGLILLGKAPISTTGGTNFVEGLTDVPYGGSDPADNSGILKYVRVWHGGKSIGQDNEINGITLAGVGNGTTVEYCEVAYNVDDGFEMFGGTVDLKYCSVHNVGDDAFDTDEGYQGRGQFLFVHRDDASDKAHEMDSKTNGDLDSTPRSHPWFSNVTIVGGSEDALRLREGTGGDFRNYIIVGGDEGVRNDDNGSETVSQTPQSTACAGNGATSGCDYLYISPNFVMNVGGDAFEDIDDSADFPGIFIDAGSDGASELGVTGDSPTPTSGGLAFENVDTQASSWFTSTAYKGAFNANENWLLGWGYNWE